MAVHAAMQAGIEALNLPFARLAAAVERLGVEYMPPFDEEYQAVAQRILIRLARRDPSVLTQTTALRTSAAIVWLALRGNQTVGRRRDVLTAEAVWRAFGVSNCARLAQAMHGALGFQLVTRDDSGYRRASIWLADAQLLHSKNRMWLIRNRSSATFVAEKFAREAAERPPVSMLPGGKVQLRARPVTPLRAVRAPDVTGRLRVVAMFGEADDPEVLALTVPDARRLVTMLSRVLDAPLASPAS